MEKEFKNEVESKTVTFRAKVGLLTRNVKISGAIDKGFEKEQYGAHLKIMGYSKYGTRVR